MTIKITRKFITVNGKRAGIRIDAGPWADHAPQDMVQIYCKNGLFPAEIRSALTITNDSNRNEDYFEYDRLRLLPGDDLYAAAKQATA